MIKKSKLALSAAATALVAVTGLAVAPQASASDMADLKARIARIEQQEADRATKLGGNMVTFRGGYARNNKDRYGDILTDTTGFSGQQNGEKDGWYVGASLDLVLSDDLFGLHDSIEVLGEIMFEYKEFDKQDLAVAPLPTLLTTVGGTNTAGSVKVSQFTLTASPKIKFMKGSRFRPWIIPVGLAIHVISPPSDGVTVLEPGMHFAAGADVRVWNNIYLGADVRYNLVFGDLDGVDMNGFTTGAYVGFGF
ncbi:MAG: porin family protein [Methyloprofundus sp.]|nr:porin family protein [Methyloprofundus sp.]